MNGPSLRARMMNAWLRLTEKPHLARVSDVTRLRRSFERKAWLSFWRPFGARYHWRDLAHLKALRISAAGGKGEVILYFHGGAYVMGSPSTHRAMLMHLCKRADASAVLPDYGKAPERPFPAAIDDAISGYEALIGEGIAAERIILGGDSAGGGLALALLGEICRLKMPMPKAAFVFSPFADLTFSGASITQNAEKDVVLPVSRLAEQREMYLGAHDPSDPRASPLFAGFEGCCPLWLTVGDTEILRDDSLRIADRMRGQGVDVTLTLEQDLPHVWPLFHGYIPEAGASLDALALWIRSL